MTLTQVSDAQELAIECLKMHEKNSAQHLELLLPKNKKETLNRSFQKKSFL